MVEYITNELKIVIVSILIFSIIFINDIDFFNSKITYLLMYIIFVLNLILLKNYPGIVILYSSLFTLLWYKHNLEEKKL